MDRPLVGREVVGGEGAEAGLRRVKALRHLLSLEGLRQELGQGLGDHEAYA
jgi:hypothetical protein